jgi:hypothetical protein
VAELDELPGVGFDDEVAGLDRRPRHAFGRLLGDRDEPPAVTAQPGRSPDDAVAQVGDGGLHPLEEDPAGDESLAARPGCAWMGRRPSATGGGRMRIGLTSIFVDDQDRAERFYTQVLGFTVKTSAAYGPGSGG